MVVPSSAEMSDEQVETMVRLLTLVRQGSARTRPELVRESGIGRKVVYDRIGFLLDKGLLKESGLAASTGGRAAREVSFGADAGHVLVAAIGNSYIHTSITDLAGAIVAQETEPMEVSEGPDPVLAKTEDLFNRLLARHPVEPWGIGVGIPGPVEFSTGRPVAPPSMPGWDGYDVRAWFETRFGVPAWVDNDVNIMALSELRAGAARGAKDMVFVKVGSGIGAGLVSRGGIHRGAEGAAGDIGHVTAVSDSKVLCRCGNYGCLGALASGDAIVRDAIEAARAGHSPMLSELLETNKMLHAIDIVRAAERDDPVSRELLQRSAQLVGEALAGIVNFFNPALIVLGGQVTAAGASYLAQVRRTVLARSLPLATRALQIVPSTLADSIGLIGGAYLVTDELFSAEHLAGWIRDHPRVMLAGDGSVR